MIDPRTQAVLIRRRDQRGYEDKTPDITGYLVDGEHVHVTYSAGKSGRTYSYAARNVLILRDPERMHVGTGQLLRARGRLVPGGSEVLCFSGDEGAWWRIFVADGASETFRTFHQQDIELTDVAEDAAEGQQILNYWRDLASRLDPKDSLHASYKDLGEVPADSVLDLYLRRSTGDANNAEHREIIFPFSSNLSQRTAIEKGLAHRISVIDGPPGTGKTQTILNLIANIIRVPGQTVGVVSFTNAAVDNVRDKLTQAGYGHVMADLGSNDKKLAFFTNKHAGNAAAQRRAGAAPVQPPETGRLRQLGDHAHHLQRTARTLAEQRQGLEAYRLEQRHFARHTDAHKPAPLPPLKVLKQSSGRVLEFLAATAPDMTPGNSWRKLVRRVRNRLRYGSARGLDPQDSDVVLQLQAAFYAKKVAELENGIGIAERILSENQFSRVEGDLLEASRQALDAGLHQRFARLPRFDYSLRNYRRNFGAFVGAYPVILSTCHSLQRSIPDGYLLDYLIIDEASQVDLLAGGLALACARNVIVVGDLRQLPHIPNPRVQAHANKSPDPSCDYQRHSVLSSFIERYGADIPRTMLREHYRCDPSIIDFCNRKFYAGQLVPYTVGNPDSRALVVVRTAPGNHMRQHSSGGRTNQREAEVIAQEVLDRFCEGTRHEEIGVVTPYRRQVDKVADALLNSIETDTVHKFQGREKEIVIMSTVLDQTKNGSLGIRFVDNPQLVNVAVSRAVRRFILVTNHEMLSTSRHIRDLVHYIQYRDPDDGVFDSGVVSVFDLLYKEYSALLEPFAARVRKTSDVASEDIASALLLDILGGDGQFSDLAVAPQVLLRNLIPDPSHLPPGQAAFLRNRASLDFLVYNRVSNRPVLAVEVDGFRFHEDDQEQQRRDRIKDAICRSQGLRLVRLPTTASGEESRIRTALLEALS